MCHSDIRPNNGQVWPMSFLLKQRQIYLGVGSIINDQGNRGNQEKLKNVTFLNFKRTQQCYIKGMLYVYHFSNPVGWIQIQIQIQVLKWSLGKCKKWPQAVFLNNENAWAFTHLPRWTFASPFAPKFVVWRQNVTSRDLTWRHIYCDVTLQAILQI